MNQSAHSLKNDGIYLEEGDLVDVLGVLLEQPLEGADPVHQALGVVQTVHAQDHLL